MAARQHKQPGRERGVLACLPSLDASSLQSDVMRSRKILSSLLNASGMRQLKGGGFSVYTCWRRRWRSNPSEKSPQEQLTRGTVTSTMRRAAGCKRCGAGAGCSAMNYQSLGQLKETDFTVALSADSTLLVAGRTLHPAPRTLNPAPCTSHPAP